MFIRLALDLDMPTLTTVQCTHKACLAIDSAVMHACMHACIHTHSMCVYTRT